MQNVQEEVYVVAKKIQSHFVFWCDFNRYKKIQNVAPTVS